MADTIFSGPLKAGTVKETGGAVTANVGYAMLAQTATLTQNSTNAVSATFSLPANAQIADFLLDVTTAFDSATSATLTIGTAAGGAQYVGAVNVKAAGRAAPTFSAAQLSAMANIGSNTLVVVTITPVGATTAGAAIVTLRYIQK